MVSLKNQKGIVRWFDNYSGVGLIRVNNKSIFVHWSAIINKTGLRNQHKKPKKVWNVLFSGQEVKVEIIEDYNWVQISKVEGLI